MDRRTFLTGLSSVALASTSTFVLDTDVASAAKGHAPIFGLPHSGQRRFAWTIDDGTSVASVRGLAQHALDNPDLKFTFFVTSNYAAWRANRKHLKELIASGQVQLGNHTRSHPDLTRLSTHGVQQQLMDCHKFIEDEFGYDARPFFRPTYGRYNAKVNAAAADVGYTVPTLWYGTFNSEQPHFTVTRMLRNINKWVANGRIVIDHSNNSFVADHFDRAYAAIQAKNLATVRLVDAFPQFAH